MIVTLTLFSDPVQLGQATSNDAGEVEIEFVAPETVGAHELVADSECPDLETGVGIASVDPFGGVFDPNGTPAAARTTGAASSSAATAAAPAPAPAPAPAAPAASPVGTKPAFTGSGSWTLGWAGFALLILGAYLALDARRRERRQG